MVVITGLAVIHCCTNCKTEWRQKFMIKVADASAQTKVRGTFIVGKQILKMITSGFLRTRLTFIKKFFAHANRVYLNNRNFSRKVNYKNTKEIQVYVIEQKRLLDHLVTLPQKNRNGKLLQINGCIYQFLYQIVIMWSRNPDAIPLNHYLQTTSNKHFS